MATVENRLVASAGVPEAWKLGRDHAAVMSALYLRGLASGELVRHRWPAVLSVLRRECADLGSAESALRRAGFGQEALALASDGVLAQAERLVGAGGVLTAACEDYPSRWHVALGWSAPPALWRRGPVPRGPFVTIVGSRSVSRAVWRFVEACSAEALRLGFTVASGGALGCDSAAAMGVVKACGSAAAPLLEVWPCGLQARRTRRIGCALSLCPSPDGFSSAAAMERNILLYALGEASIIGQSRFREGGTWRGAVEAHRRRVARLAVRWDPQDRAARALVALGAYPLKVPEELEAALEYGGTQPRLAIAGA